MCVESPETVGSSAVCDYVTGKYHLLTDGQHVQHPGDDFDRSELQYLDFLLISCNL